MDGRRGEAQTAMTMSKTISGRTIIGIVIFAVVLAGIVGLGAFLLGHDAPSTLIRSTFWWTAAVSASLVTIEKFVDAVRGGGFGWSPPPEPDTMVLRTRAVLDRASAGEIIWADSIDTDLLEHLTSQGFVKVTWSAGRARLWITPVGAAFGRKVR